MKLDDIKKGSKKLKSPSKKKKELYKSSSQKISANLKQKSLYEILYHIAKPYSY